MKARVCLKYFVNDCRLSMDPKIFEWNRNKIEKNQENCILAVLNNYLSNYSELFQSSGSGSMKNYRLRAKTYEVFKTLYTQTLGKEYFIWLYVLIMSRTRFRVNRHSRVAWMSTPCLNQARYLKLKWLQRDSNPQPLSS